MQLLRTSLSLSIVLFQVAAICYARFVPARYFCWAPFDMQTDYQIEARINGTRLSAAQLRARYRRSAKGTDNRSVQHVIDIIQQAEERYHSSEHSEIVVKYRINGKAEQEWRFTRN